MQAKKNVTKITGFVCKSERRWEKEAWHLYVRASGRFPEWTTAASRMHMLLCFEREIDGKSEQRLYPFFVRCTPAREGGTQFQGEVSVQTEHIFMDFVMHHEEIPFAVFLLYVNQEMQWEQRFTGIRLETGFLVKRTHRENAFLLLGKRIAYGFCTLLLPLWMLSGALALKGIGRLRPAAHGMSGKKAIIYHAHDLVKGWTGYGYSVREVKTNYFKRCYQKFVTKNPKTEGILFLSERPVDAGGNLDCVRKLLRESSSVAVHEFLTEQPVHKLTWKELKECAEAVAQARVIVLEDFFPQLHALALREETEVLQLWHACGAFKLFGLSELGRTSLPQATRNHRNYTAALTSSEGIVPFYSEAFGIAEQCVLPIGVPRTDIFFDETYRERITGQLYEKYPTWQGKRIVLFAPTFRGSGNKTAYYPMERFPVDEVMQNLPQDTVLIVKQHPFVKLQLQVSEAYRERVFDLTGKENINDVLFVTNLLVTDYSSSVFEAALLDIPILFYAFDLENYLAERDLYFDFSSFAPGKIIGEFAELLAEMNAQLQQDNAVTVDETFRRFFLGALDGHSTERTVQLIEHLYDGRE